MRRARRRNRVPALRNGGLAATATMALLLATGMPAHAQDEQTLARAARNPLAALTNVQFFYDANLGTGPDNRTQHVLTFQPVIPFDLSDNWSVITRTILPMIAQPGTTPGAGWTNGPGDSQFSAFLSPAKGDKLVWGVGPVLQLPSASNDALGQGKWGAGPTAAAIWFGEQWSVGALVNNIWSFAGSSDRPAVNQMQLQPQINYNFADNPDRYLSFSPTITANWKATGSERWTVPLSLGIGQLFKFGKQPVNLQATGYYNVIKPADAANWTLELQVQFLFPK